MGKWQNFDFQLKYVSDIHYCFKAYVLMQSPSVV